MTNRRQVYNRTTRVNLMNISSIRGFLTEDAAKTLPRQHVYIGPIWDLCGLEYRPHMGYTWGIHIGSENGFRMGPIWYLSGIQFFLRYITHVSHVDPIHIYFPCGYQMNARCFPDGSRVNPGLTPGFLDVFY